MAEQPNAEELKANVKNTNVWVRLFFMALFAMLYWAVEVVLVIVVLFQFLSVLLTGNKNDKVLSFGAQISTYAYQIFRFLTFNTEEKPFPLTDWPTDEALGTKTVKEPAQATEETEKPKRAPRKRTTKKEAPKTKKKVEEEKATEKNKTDDKPSSAESSES